MGVVAVVGYVLVQFISFQLSLTRVPATWTIGGQTYPNYPIDEAAQQAADDLQHMPLMLHYYTQTIQLEPAAIGFTVDVTETTRLLRQTRSQNAALSDFLRHLIFQPPAAETVPAVTGYSDEKLRAQLADIAARFDRAAQPPQPVTQTMTLAAGQPGYQLDIVKSIEPIEAALKSAQRDVTLSIQERPAPAPDLDQVGRLLQARLAAFNGTASVFVKDLRTGHELDLNPNLAYSGVGLMKLAMLTEVYRKTNVPLDANITRLITNALRIELVNGPGNDLLTTLGDGDALAAANNVTTLMKNLGLRDTFMLQPYDQPISPTLTIATTANTSPAVNVNADPSIQTTATDMGLLLEMVYQCSNNGGALLVVYPKLFNAADCRDFIEQLRQNSPTDVPLLLRGGVPDPNQVAHHPGWNADTRADAALVTTPGGSYVIVVFLHAREQDLDWAGINAIMSDLNLAIYNYFNH